MRTDQAKTIRLSEYRPPAYLVDRTELTFRLSPSATRVSAQLHMRPNPDAVPGQPLMLDGEAMKLIGAAIDGDPLQPSILKITDEGLSLAAEFVPDGPFIWSCETEIDPSANTALEGLYMSRGMYCTQCEAEGFRKITFYPDRPDVMSVFTVRIEGDLPVMLSNGNLTTLGDGWVEWHDPWPKPAYLFALVAGDLVSVDDSFTTASGREVTLKIYVRDGDQDKCDYAMDALKRSMRWDETEYGREYDLDLFMIVAVDDFNMGAMENKGLNIFNSKYVLASPETATDRDYELIEGIIAHEYFHNWTGNRITCRDWFQLCLKEGLTVFRDQQFSGDQRSHAVKRIDDVLMLRGRQFREDAGPLAHPVRPEEYIEINNFYTATVYEKGAEVIGMLRLLVGADAYSKALDLYFERHDGQACTIEDWLQVFEDATARDLSQFKRWYSQAGTPRVRATGDWTDGTYTLTLSQSTVPTPGQPDKQDLVIPVAIGLLAQDGSEMRPTEVLELTQAEQSFRFEGLPGRPVLSLLRGFSAPVILERDVTNAERAFLLAHDTDPFNKWEAGRAYMLDLLTRSVLGEDVDDPAFLAAVVAMARDDALDPATRALLLSLPTDEAVGTELFQAGHRLDPDAIHEARWSLDRKVAEALGDDLYRLFETMAVPGPYMPDAAAAGRRALRGRMLSLISKLEEGRETAKALFSAADNMTEQMAALSQLVGVQAGRQEVADFYDQWKTDRLVIDKWFSVQAMRAPGATAPEDVAALTEHPDFDWKNPNRFRALLGAFAVGNMAGFHHADGTGYKLLADWLIRLDPLNPQTTARLAGAFETWRRFDEPRQALMLTQLQRIADTPELSKDTSEIVGRILDA